MAIAAARAALNNNDAKSGVIAARRGDGVQLLGDNTSGWTSARWEFLASTADRFDPPPGWDYNASTGVYSCVTTSATDFRPPSFRLRGFLGFKVDVTLTVNETLVDRSLRLNVLTDAGLEHTLFPEAFERSGALGFIAAVNRNWDAIDRRLAAPIGIVSTVAAGLAPRIDALSSITSQVALTVDEAGVPGWRAVTNPGTAAIQPLADETDTVGLWHLNGSLTAVVGPNLTLDAGTETYTDIVPGKTGFYFNGSTRLKVAAFNAALALAGDMTAYSIWQLDTDPTGSTIFFGHGAPGDASAASNILYSMTSATGEPPRPLRWLSEHGATGINDTYVTGSSVSIPPIHNIFLLGVTRSANTIQFYFNGLPFGALSSALTAPDGGGSGVLYVGASDGTTNMTRAVCWGLQIINTTRTAAQHKAKYNATIGLGYGLVA